MSRRENRIEYLSSESGAAAYDAEYYRTGCGPEPYEHNAYWAGFFGSVAGALIEYLKPQTVFDAGCALGFLVEAFRDRGVQAWGADISEFAIRNVREDIRPYCRVASITDPVAVADPVENHRPRRYDLVACIEVLEHLTTGEVTRAIANMAAVTDNILFSSTPSDLEEPTHINVLPPIEWMQQFAAVGFSPDLAFNSTVVSPQAMLLRRHAPPLPYEVQVLYNDAILLNCAMALQNPEVPPPAQVKPGHLLSEAFDKSLDILTISRKLDEFVHKNTEMSNLINGISAVNQDMLKRNADLEQRNEELLRQLSEHRRRPALPVGQPAGSADLTAPPNDRERELLHVLFDGSYYLARYEDVRNAGVDPFDHFMANGAAEGRSPHPLFDNEYYVTHYPEAAAAGVNPVLHFLRAGAAAGFNPHPLFDTLFYCDEYTDVVEAGKNPLIHFIQNGAAERRNPHPYFNTGAYLAANPDVAASGVNALIHYLLAGIGEGRPLRNRVPVEDLTPYATRIATLEPRSEELDLQRIIARQFLQQPVISVVVPVYRVSLKILKAMVESVRSQSYPRWELCIAHGDPEDRVARAWLRTQAQDDRRIKLEFLEENLGIGGNSNRALALATGEFIGLLDHDDTLAPFALYETVKVINEKPDVDFLYSDKDCLNERGERVSPLFKPRWSPELMLSANYLTHFCVMRTAHVHAVGGWRSETDGAQDWDLFFRVTERARRIEFIDKVLYHWGIVETSVASGGLKAKPYALKGQLQTMSERLSRMGVKGTPALEANGAMHIHWILPEPDRGISIILVSDDPGDRIVGRARDLRARIPHAFVEIVVAAPDVSDHRENDILTVRTPAAASLAQRLNTAVAASTGWSIIFLDDCVDPGPADWVSDLAGPLQLDKVAMVGAQLLDPVTHCVRHAGIVFNRDGEMSYIFAGESEHAYGVFGGPSWCRNWSAVSGACFAIRRSVFDQVGGFSENPAYPRLDIDLCLRVTIRYGWRIFYNAYARFYQVAPTRLEDWTRQDRGPARDYARRCFPLGDPFFHPRLTCYGGKVRLAFGTDTSYPRMDYIAEARALTSAFDVSENAISESRKRTQRTPATHNLREVTWFLPEFAHPFYGGVYTILRAADYFRRAHQVHSTFVTPSPDVVMRSVIRSAFPALANESGMIELAGDAQLPSLPDCDAAIATLWTTAYSVLRFPNARRKFYFMQDYESRFYPAGSISALVEATYHFGFSAICNTISLRDIYRNLGNPAENAEFFDPCVDSSVFHANGRASQPRNEPLTLFCYARPTHPRNSFELLSEALRILKRRMKDKVRIITAGAEWSPRQFGLEGVLHNVGLLGYQSTGALYRTCTAGVALMMTSHPSYLPFELMACGALVVTNHNPANSWLLKDRENCLLAETSPTALAEALEEGLGDPELRDMLVNNGAALIRDRYSDWDASMEKIHRYIVESV